MLVIQNFLFSGVVDSEGKGWAIKSIEELPAGAFVFKFIGKILTNTEIDMRNKSS